MTTMTNNTVQSNKNWDTQLSTKRRLRRRERMSVVSLVFLVSCITIGQCLAFHSANPYSNRAFGRLHATTEAEEDVSSKTEQSSSPTSPIVTHDRQEFEMQVGRAMDTLRDDYPDILVKDLDYSIYEPDLELIDPSGVHLHGVKNYENAIRLVHTMVGIFYCPEESDLKFRMCFDKARRNIRIHWNARVVPKAIFGGYKTTLHVDGISIYELDRVSGNITQHRLERLVMNDAHLSPEQGVFAALRKQAIQSQVDGIPSFHRHMEAMTQTAEETIYNNIGNGEVSFQTKNMPENILRFRNKMKMNHRGSLLFDENDSEGSLPSLISFITASSSRSRLNSNSVSSSASSEADASSSDQSIPHMDSSTAALEKKNMARKKFGLKPMNMEDFIELERQVKDMDVQHQKKVAAAAMEAMELAREKQQKDNRGGILGKLFGEALKDTCESNYDCERPEVCCDFGFKKMCCSSGLNIVEGLTNPMGQREMIRVPIPNPNPYPGNDPRNRDKIYQ